jgi:hypothetical protein
MNVGRETLDQSYSARFQLLRFVQKTCTRMVESNPDKIPEAWMALCFATLIAHPDLELRFRKLLLDDPDMPVEPFLRGALDILQLAIDRVQSCDPTDANRSDVCGRDDLAECAKNRGAEDSPAQVVRSLLLYLRQEAKDMLANSDYEFLPMWEYLLRISLIFMSRTHEATERPRCLDMAPAERLRVGLDVIRDVLFRRKPKHKPRGLNHIECSA